jgi:hypothetical protein
VAASEAFDREDERVVSGRDYLELRVHAISACAPARL